MNVRKCDRSGFCVEPMSERKIQDAANIIRRLFYPVGHKYVDVIDLIERKLPFAFEGFNYEVVESNELPDREAEMNPYEYCIRMRTSVYEGACNHDGRSRFTIAHELGHFFLHRNQTLAFGRPAEDGLIPAFRHSEWQADTFARNLLAPLDLAKGLSVPAIAAVFEVSKEVATIVCRESAQKFAPFINTTAPTIQCVLPGFGGLF